MKTNLNDIFQSYFAESIESRQRPQKASTPSRLAAPANLVEEVEHEAARGVIAEEGG